MSSLRSLLTPLLLALLAILPARAQPAPPSTLSTGVAGGSLRGAPRVALDEARGLVALTRTHDDGLRGALDGAAPGR